MCLRASGGLFQSITSLNKSEKSISFSYLMMFINSAGQMANNVNLIRCRVLWCLIYVYIICSDVYVRVNRIIVVFNIIKLCFPFNTTDTSNEFIDTSNLILFLSSGLIYPVVTHWAWTDEGWLLNGATYDIDGKSVKIGYSVSQGTILIQWARTGQPSQS